MVRTLVAGVLLAGCASQTSSGSCGESFCLPPSANMIQKSQPVEDFLLYRVLYKGREFHIYEGNQPSPLESARETTVSDGTRVKISIGQGQAIVRRAIVREKRWPLFLQVSTSIDSKAQKDLLEFVSQLEEPTR